MVKEWEQARGRVRKNFITTAFTFRNEPWLKGTPPDVATTINNLINDWYKANCSQETEDNAWSYIQDNETLVMEYIKTWKAIAAPVLAKSFNDETLVIRGETVRYVMERTAQFGINNYLALQRDCTQHWNFHNAFFFAGTVATTIGKCLNPY